MAHALERAGRAATRFRLTKPFEELPKKVADGAARRRGRPAGRARHPGQVSIDEEIASEAYREWFMQYMSPSTCPDCDGKRLKPSSLAVRVKGVTIAELTGMSVTRALETVKRWKLTGARAADRRARGGEIRNRLEFLVGVGLEYLSLERSAATLSGGEAQRIRLATQIGSKLRGVLYVLDEPSIGLHPRDNDRLLDSLARLRDLGNTVLVVEHDAETIERADYVIDLGPGAGRLGGELVAQGTPAEIERNPDSLTGQYLAGAREIAIAGRAPHADRAPHRDPGRDGAQSQEHRRRVSAGTVHRGDGRFGQRKIDAGERHSVSRGGEGRCMDRAPSRARTHPSRVWI